MVMSQAPPSLFESEMRVALANIGWMKSGTLPESSRLTSSVNVAIKLLPASFARGEVASFKFWGREPQGPHAVPGANARTAFLTSCSDNSICGVSVEGVGRRLMLLVGCLLTSRALFSIVDGTTVSSLDANLTARAFDVTFIQFVGHESRDVGVAVHLFNGRGRRFEVLA